MIVSTGMHDIGVRRVYDCRCPETVGRSKSAFESGHDALGSGVRSQLAGAVLRFRRGLYGHGDDVVLGSGFEIKEVRTMRVIVTRLIRIINAGWGANV